LGPKQQIGVRRPLHHRVYVVLLENPRGDGRNGHYVGMTGLTLEERFANHKRGHKSASIVRKYGVGLAWDLFDGIPAMSYQEAALAEPTLADDLRDLGYLVYGPTNRQPLKRPRRHVRRRRRAGLPSPDGSRELVVNVGRVHRFRVPAESVTDQARDERVTTHTIKRRRSRKVSAKK
jgi:hypothetical protein